MISSVCVVRAQETPTPKQFVEMANNEINNFYVESPGLWFNVSQAIIFQSFSDIAKARTDVTVTDILLSQNDSSALTVAAEAAFLARRANYRLFVFMTSRLLENAGEALDTIPSYMARPVDIVETYQNAVSLCRAENLTQVFTGYPGSPQQVSELFNQMYNSEEQLWWNKDSVANLARSVIQNTDMDLLDSLIKHHSVIDGENAANIRKIISEAFNAFKEQLITLALVGTNLEMACTACSARYS